jgi:hypothetical protein
MSNTRSLNVKITSDSSDFDKGTKHAEKSLGELEKAGQRVGSSLHTSVSSAGTRMGASLRTSFKGIAGIAGIAGVGVGAAFAKGLSGAIDVQDANNTLKAQLGLSSKESARLGRIAGTLYASNYGDSLEQVNGAIRSVVTDIDGMGKSTGAHLQGFTGDVMSVSKAFDQDLGGVTRASASSCAPASRRTRRTR